MYHITLFGRNQYIHDHNFINYCKLQKFRCCLEICSTENKLSKDWFDKLCFSAVQLDECSVQKLGYNSVSEMCSWGYVLDILL